MWLILLNITYVWFFFTAVMWCVNPVLVSFTCLWPEFILCCLVFSDWSAVKVKGCGLFFEILSWGSHLLGAETLSCLMFWPIFNHLFWNQVWFCFLLPVLVVFFCHRDFLPCPSLINFTFVSLMFFLVYLAWCFCHHISLIQVFFGQPGFKCWPCSFFPYLGLFIYLFVCLN